MSAKRIVIIGAGGFARELLDIIYACNEVTPAFDVSGFVVESSYFISDSIIHGVPLLGDFAWIEDHAGEVYAVCAVGDPVVRKRLVEQAAALGVRFCSVVHPSAIISRWVSIGEGSVVAPGCIIGNDTQIGRHVHLNPNCTVAHDVVCSDYVSLAPGAIVSGNVTLGIGVYVGAGVNIIQKLTIGDWTIVGAGSVIIRNAESNVTICGVPGRVIKRR